MSNSVMPRLAVGLVLAVGVLALAGFGSGTLQLQKIADPSTPLMHAAISGEVDAVRDLLKGGADVNAQRGAWTTIGVFVDHGPVEPKYGETALLQAIDGRNPAVVRLLLEAGADVTARDSAGNGVWEHAVQALDESDSSILRTLARTVPTPMDLADRIFTSGRPLDDYVLEYALSRESSASAREVALCDTAVRGDIQAMDRLLQTFDSPPPMAFDCAYRAWGNEGSAAQARKSIDYLIASGADPGDRPVPVPVLEEMRYACPLICIKTTVLQGCTGGCAVPSGDGTGGSGSGYWLRGTERDGRIGKDARVEVVLRHATANQSSECAVTLDLRILGARKPTCDKAFGPVRIAVLPQ